MLSCSVVREFNALVDAWEMNERIKKSDPVEAALKDLILVNVLREVISDDSILSWLNTLDSYGDVHNKSDKSQTQR